jgi:RND family efflux transporter MFP subunit
MKFPRRYYGLPFFLLAAFGAGAPALAQTPFECIIEPEMSIELSSPVDGVIETVRVDKGDRIKQGQVLVLLGASVERAALAMARASADMSNEIESAKVRSEYMKRKSEQYALLFQRKAISAFDKDQVDTDALLARLEVKKTENEQHLAKLNVAQAEAALKQRELKSPISGVVVERFLHAGESVKDHPVLKLAKIDPLRVEVVLPAEMFGQIAVGMNARVRPETPQQESYAAEVSVVDPVIDGASGTFGVRLKLPNPGAKLAGGLKCQVEFAFNSSE